MLPCVPRINGGRIQRRSSHGASLDKALEAVPGLLHLVEDGTAGLGDRNGVRRRGRSRMVGSSLGFNQPSGSKAGAVSRTG